MQRNKKIPEMFRLENKERDRENVIKTAKQWGKGRRVSQTGRETENKVRDKCKRRGNHFYGPKDKRITTKTKQQSGQQR